MSRTAATGHSGSSADLPSRPDRPRQEIGLHKQNQTPTFPAGFPRRFFLLPQCLQGGRTCRAGEVVGRPMVAPTFIAGTAIKFVGAGIAARLSQSSPHLVGADALMPSEEGCSIPFPPGRRKLHIRSLLLPLRKATVSLGCLSVFISLPQRLASPYEGEVAFAKQMPERSTDARDRPFLALRRTNRPHSRSSRIG